MQKTLIVVGGPTASGKTGLAVQVAKHFKTEVVNADSRQFYKELSVGTAKPTEEELKGVPHYLLGHISVDEPYTIASYAEAAEKVLDSLFERYNQVVLVGGSGMYIKALLQGVDEMPTITPELRQALNQEFKEKGLDWLQNEVSVADPEFYQQTDTQNHARLLRALEVIRTTRKPFSYFRKGSPKPLPFQVKEIAYEWSREALYQRCDLRVDQMMAQGLLEEVTALEPFKDLQALRTVGYSELFSYLAGELTLPEAIELIKKNTRNYAKRQLTWFKNQHPEMQWFAPDVEVSSIVKWL
jgi:tRNA dimethylallyltransferase